MDTTFSLTDALLYASGFTGVGLTQDLPTAAASIEDISPPSAAPTVLTCQPLTAHE